MYICIKRALAEFNNFQILIKHPLSQQECVLYDYSEGINVIDWNTMEKPGTTDDYSRNVKMAECLTDKCIPAELFQCVYVPDMETKQYIENLFENKGIAYQFKMRFPENNKSYVKVCKSGELTVGKVHYYIEEGITIINFPTKNKWRENSKIEYITKGLDAFIELLPRLEVKKIAIPPLGCGNGGLIWNEVKEIIEKKIANLSDKYDFVIFEPSVSYKAIPKKPPQISLSGLVLLDIRLNLKKFNSIRLQKTGYFVNLFLEEGYFKFDKWKYGPYSHSIDIVARNIKEYQEYYGIDNSQATFEQVYRVICSEKIDSRMY